MLPQCGNVGITHSTMGPCPDVKFSLKSLIFTLSYLSLITDYNKARTTHTAKSKEIKEDPLLTLISIAVENKTKPQT